ncbi:MAG: hypothetical protein IT393_05345 [Nitrospirae bacterium]|nr:hypothetical protein [Nitrospirota bacterium]
MSTIKHHHIRFRNAPAAGGVNDWTASLRTCKGITNISIDTEKNDLFAEYDLKICKEEDVERCMLDIGFVLEDSVMERIKRGWIHFTEENEQSEFKHKGASCCDISEIEEKRKRD